jgi:hypothetical protein
MNFIHPSKLGNSSPTIKSRARKSVKKDEHHYNPVQFTELRSDISDIISKRIIGRYNTKALREEITYEINVLLNHYYPCDVEWKVICNETNNTPDLIDLKEFHLDLNLKLFNSYRFQFVFGKCSDGTPFSMDSQILFDFKNIEEYKEEDTEWF